MIRTHSFISTGFWKLKFLIIVRLFLKKTITAFSNQLIRKLFSFAKPWNSTTVVTLICNISNTNVCSMYYLCVVLSFRSISLWCFVSLLKLRLFEIFWLIIHSVQWPCYVLLHYIMRNKTLWGHWMDQYEDQKMTNGLSLRLKTFKDNWMKWQNDKKMSHGLDLSHCTLARLPHEMHQPSIAKSWKSKHFRSFFPRDLA